MSKPDTSLESLHPPTSRVVPWAAFFAVLGLATIALHRIAHADTGTPSPTGGIDWIAIVAIVGVVLGGASLALGGLSTILHAIAPRTRTVVDDRIADAIGRAHDKLEELVALLRGIAPAKPSASETSAAPTSAALTSAAAASSAASSIAAKAGSAAMLVLLVLAIGGAALTTACATVRPAVATGAVAALDCEAQHFDAQLLADATHLAEATVERWIRGTGDKPSTEAITADLVAIRSALGQCAVTGALAAATALAASPSGISAHAESPPSPSALLEAFIAARVAAGWAPVRLADGTVL